MTFKKTYYSISEVSKMLNIQEHTIRFWESKFKQIKPIILNGNRRYYDEKNIKLLKRVHFLLKEQGMTIKGVKKILDNKEPLKLYENKNNLINSDIIKKKLIKLSTLIKKLK